MPPAALTTTNPSQPLSAGFTFPRFAAWFRAGTTTGTAKLLEIATANNTPHAITVLKRRIAPGASNRDVLGASTASERCGA
jgi:hypothetical protein